MVLEVIYRMQVVILVDAYKRSELEQSSGLGIYALSAIIVDKAEPSEALKANIVWSLGLDNSKHLLSSLQLDSFRKQQELFQKKLTLKLKKELISSILKLYCLHKKIKNGCLLQKSIKTTLRLQN